MATLPTFDSNGYRGLTLEEIRENMRESTDGASDLGPEVSVGAHTLYGMDLDATAIELSYCYDLLGDIVASGDANAAEGVQQDNLNQLRGAIRNPARKSTAILTLGGTPATVIAAGKISAIPNGGERWIHDADATIGGGGTVDVAATAENTGPIEAAIGAITEIVTAVAGWTSVTNAAAAILGEDVESDADYRTRSEGTGAATTTEEALYTRLSEHDDIDAVVVVSNRTDTTDSNGTPPHALWIVVYPNTANQQDIAETIWGVAGAPAGINMRGAVTATVTDDNGYTQQIRWDWAASADLWCSVVGTKDDNYPAGGDNLVKQAIENYFATVRVGQDVYPLPIESQIAIDVPGLKTMEARIKIGGAPGGGDIVPITIAINQYALLNGTIGVTVT